MHDELMAGVAEDPDDEGRWAVLLDWLITHGDPRGELAIASDPEASLRSQAAVWFGAEARVTGSRVILGGDPEQAFPSDSSVTLEFARGHVRRLRVDVVHDLTTPGYDPQWGATWVPKLVRRVLSQPVGQLIQAIEIHQRPDWTGELRCDDLLDALVAGGVASLRSLAWGCEHDWEFVELPDLDKLLRAAPRLESLTLQGEGGLDGPLRHSRLRTLGLGGMQADSLECFTDAELPALEHLAVWLEFDDTREVDAEFDLDRLAPLMATNLPSLRTLTLPGCPQAEEVRAWLVEAEWFAQLERLTLD